MKTENGMKKITWIICVIAVMIFFAGLAGCSGPSGEDEPQAEESSGIQTEAPASEPEEPSETESAETSGGEYKAETEEPSEAEPAETSGGKYKNGTYEGVARGYKKGLHVKATVEDGLIVDIQVTDNHEDEPYLTDSLVIIPEIIETQSTEVDAIASATKTCEGILKAVDDALSQAES
jgi:uncharacterized protein with FMN-binding domain